MEIRISFTEEEIKELKERSGKCSIQDYIRMQLFNYDSIYTPEFALERARRMNKEEFFLRDLYSDEEWAVLGRGKAGTFGRQFYNFSMHDDSVEFLGVFSRRSKYRLIERGDTKNDRKSN